jgi:hypothetical protein
VLKVNIPSYSCEVFTIGRRFITASFAVIALSILGAPGAQMSPFGAALTHAADISHVVPIPPARLLDTRGNGTVDGMSNGGGPLAAGQVVEVQVGGRYGIPANAVAAVLNVTALKPVMQQKLHKQRPFE